MVCKYFVGVKKVPQTRCIPTTPGMPLDVTGFFAYCELFFEVFFRLDFCRGGGEGERELGRCRGASQALRALSSDLSSSLESLPLLLSFSLSLSLSLSHSLSLLLLLSLSCDLDRECEDEEERRLLISAETKYAMKSSSQRHPHNQCRQRVYVCIGCNVLP